MHTQYVGRALVHETRSEVFLQSIVPFVISIYLSSCEIEAMIELRTFFV